MSGPYPTVDRFEGILDELTLLVMHLRPSPSSRDTFSSAPNWGATSAAAMARLRSQGRRAWDGAGMEDRTMRRGCLVSALVNEPLVLVLIQSIQYLQLGNVQWAIEAIQTGRMSSMAKAGRRPVPVTVPNIHVAGSQYVTWSFITIPIQLFHFDSIGTSSYPSASSVFALPFRRAIVSFWLLLFSWCLGF